MPRSISPKEIGGNTMRAEVRQTCGGPTRARLGHTCTEMVMRHFSHIAGKIDHMFEAATSGTGEEAWSASPSALPASSLVGLERGFTDGIEWVS